MRILIDGHNALEALEIRGRTHEERRNALVSRVAALGKRAVVYFDARRAPEGLLDREAFHGVLVQYCRDRPADDYILDAVRDAAAPGDLLVVSNDRQVTGTAKEHGARISRVEEFFAAPPRPKPARRSPRIRNDYKPSDFGLPETIDLDDPNLD